MVCVLDWLLFCFCHEFLWNFSFLLLLFLSLLLGFFVIVFFALIFLSVPVIQKDSVKLFISISVLSFLSCLVCLISHCNVPGNEAADSLAKEGTTKEQVDRSTSYPEVKTILKAKQHSKWRHKHPRYNKAEPYYLLTRREQVTVFRLRTGHNRLNYHLYSKLRIGHTEQCPCGTGSQTTEHLLHFCPTYEPLRKGIWPDHTPVARKLYGSLRDLRCTATFIGETGVSIWRTRRRSMLNVHSSPLFSLSLSFFFFF